MQTLGNRLEEGRKQKGVSIREAAEATKIRAEYLERFESDDFEIDLPDIYKRGFVRIYARFLGLNPQATSNELQAYLNRQRSPAGRAAGRPAYGQMEIRDRHDTGSEAQAEPPARSPVPSMKRPSLGLGRRERIAEEADADMGPEEGGDLTDRTFYYKVGAIVSGVVIVVIFLVAMIRLIIGGDDSQDPGRRTLDPNPDLSSDATVLESSPSSEGEIVLRASGGNTWIAVKDMETGRFIDQGELQSGQVRRVPVTGLVEIVATRGEFLEVEKAGEVYQPAKSGTVKISIP